MNSLLSARLAELEKAAEPFASPRATMRDPQAGFIENDLLHVEVTMGDWHKLLTALGRAGAGPLPMYAELGKGEFSPEFISEVERIEKAVDRA
jgi:hypothetical protein